jgi:C-terminal processing protease CtpA/Prc
MDYFFRVLSPMAAIRLTVQSPGGEPRQLEIASKLTPAKRAIDLTDDQTYYDLLIASDNEAEVHRFQRSGDIVIWKMGEFNLTPEEVDDTVKAKVKDAAALVLDLRGNGGGAVLTLERLVSHFFDHQIQIAERKGRKKMEPMAAKKRTDKPFAGKLVVLVDSDSASASEVFARLVQIEKRATVLGDRSQGSVMQARYFDGASGSQSIIVFGASITDADLIMSDGKSLENVGVTPDEVVVPTPEDLAAGRDPALARAVALVGGSLMPEAAGKLFPFKWRK